MDPGEGSGSNQHSVEPNAFTQLDDKIRHLLEKVGDLPPIDLPPIEGSEQFNNAKEQYEDLSGAIRDLLKESFQINELTINYLNARIENRNNFDEITQTINQLNTSHQRNKDQKNQLLVDMQTFYNHLNRLHILNQNIQTEEMHPAESSGSIQQSVEPNVFNQLDDKIRPLLEGEFGDLPPIEGIAVWEFENSGPHQINNARDQYENLSRAITYLLNESIRINEFAFEFLNAKIKARNNFDEINQTINRLNYLHQDNKDRKNQLLAKMQTFYDHLNQLYILNQNIQTEAHSDTVEIRQIQHGQHVQGHFGQGQPIRGQRRHGRSGGHRRSG
uniref:Uncharacterized protein n=1 Tax=Meloidogyne javanica TaxID=6303 RepID=A0A915LHU2_MELJA